MHLLHCSNDYHKMIFSSSLMRKKVAFQYIKLCTKYMEFENTFFFCKIASPIFGLLHIRTDKSRKRIAGMYFFCNVLKILNTWKMSKRIVCIFAPLVARYSVITRIWPLFHISYTDSYSYYQALEICIFFTILKKKITVYNEFYTLLITFYKRLLCDL